jgi:SP family sugar:H+ symporter-like MFS transporter
VHPTHKPTQFYTYSSYFFSAAGFNDPFAVTCITNAIQLVTILAVVATVDRFGRRNIACGGLTTMLVGILLIGIMGVIKSNKATNALLVLFSCVYSGCRPHVSYVHVCTR